MWRRYLAVMIYFAVNALCSALKNIAKKALFIEKRLFHGQGRLSPKNRESAFVYAPRGLSIPASRQEKTHKRQPVKDFPKAAPLRAGGRSQGFPFSFGSARFFRTEKTPQRKNGAATRTAKNSHDRTIFLVSPALSRSAPQTAPNISTNLCPTRSQEVR